MIITCDCFSGVFELKIKKKNHSHMSGLLLHLRIVLREEYVEGNEITGVSVLLSNSQYPQSTGP